MRAARGTVSSTTVRELGWLVWVSNRELSINAVSTMMPTLLVKASTKRYVSSRPVSVSGRVAN